MKALPVYHNPVRRGFYPDPSVCRHGDDYYMVNSTFQYWPAIVISHSRDLVNWRTIGHGVSRTDWLDLSDLADSHGIWAADISWHEGRFWIYATLRLNNPPEGTDIAQRTSPLRRQIVIHAEQPEGPWSQPVFIDVDNIDPSHFVDDDGTRYMLISPGINMVRLSPDGLSPVGEPFCVWPGTGRRCPEGPHLFRKDGWYYALLAEGGTGFGHCITAARSRRLEGPWEECPHNPLITQADPEGAIQRTGHGKFVRTPAGDWYCLFLCGRNNEGPWTTLGRETALEPVTWTADGWPLINGGKGPSTTQHIPALTPHPWPDIPATDHFDSSSLSHEWQWVRTSSPSDWSLTERPGFIRLWTAGPDPSQLPGRNILVRRERSHRFLATCTLDFPVSIPGPQAGLISYYGTNNHIMLVRCWQGGDLLRLVENRNGQVRVRAALPVPPGPLDLKLETRGQARTFFWRSPGGNWSLVGSVEDCTFLSDEGVTIGKHHTGTLTGLCAHHGSSGHRIPADFDHFTMEDMTDA